MDNEFLVYASKKNLQITKEVRKIKLLLGIKSHVRI